jgi:hypothetical protein
MPNIVDLDAEANLAETYPQKFDRVNRKVLESVRSFVGSSKDLKLVVASFSYAELNTAGTGVAVESSVVIPANSIILSATMNFTEEFSGDGDSASTLALQVEVAGDIQNATALGDFGLGTEVGYDRQLTSVARPLSMTWAAGGTDTELDAGAVDLYVLYITI